MRGEESWARRSTTRRGSAAGPGRLAGPMPIQRGCSEQRRGRRRSTAEATDGNATSGHGSGRQQDEPSWGRSSSGTSTAAWRGGWCRGLASQAGMSWAFLLQGGAAARKESEGPVQASPAGQWRVRPERASRTGARGLCRQAPPGTSRRCVRPERGAAAHEASAEERRL